MANITLAGTLRDPNGDLAVGDKIRFTHKSTTGETVKSASSILTIDPTGVYSVDLEYGLILVEYKDARNSQFENLGVATVNGTNPATTIPELLNALVPVSSADLIEFQAILADCVAAKDAAEAAAATLDLINDPSQAYEPWKTVAAMQNDATILPVGKKVFWQGYYTESDGGSNWGVVKSGAHTDDGGSVFTLADGKYVQANHGNVRLNIKKFGAKGDGVNDTQSILTAAAYSKNLKIPIGDFVLSAAALEYVTKNDISITGYGDSSLLRRLDKGNVIFISGCNRINISKVQVNGKFEYQSGAGAINLTDCSSFNIRNNYVSSSSRQGIKTENSIYGSIRGNRVTGSYQDGIMVRTESRRVTVVGNVCWNNGDANFAVPIGEGIHLFAVQDCVVNANICYANSDNGIALEGADNCVISGNSCSANVVSGISLNKEEVSARFNSGTIISGNTCQDNGSDGIVISACQDMVVSTNTCTENGGYGITQGVSSEVTQTRISTLNNTIRDNALGGILHNWNNEDCQIKGNMVRGSVGTGILINRVQSIDTEVSGNNVKAFPSAQITDYGTDSTIYRNKGYKTESSGVISSNDVSTAWFINHGLDYTPSISDINVILGTSTSTPMGAFGVINPNATQFTVKSEGPAGAGGASIYWTVRKL